MLIDELFSERFFFYPALQYIRKLCHSYQHFDTSARYHNIFFNLIIQHATCKKTADGNQLVSCQKLRIRKEISMHVCSNNPAGSISFVVCPYCGNTCKTRSEADGDFDDESENDEDSGEEETGGFYSCNECFKGHKDLIIQHSLVRLLRLVLSPGLTMNVILQTPRTCYNYFCHMIT
jgi:hypothetical protein